MVKKISRELTDKFHQKEPGPFRISIWPQDPPKLITLKTQNRYDKISDKRQNNTSQEMENLLFEISKDLDFYSLEKGKDYSPNSTIGNITATLTQDQITELAENLM
ncbi:hypothetical protein HOE04_01700 [archaeon]|jgi:hypothetical protein|nr:hypothetical protein [archaeon]